MNRFRSIAPLLVAALVVLGGCTAEVTPPPPPPPPDWLWVTVWGGRKFVAFDPVQIESGATGTEASLAFGLGPDRSPYGLVFDTAGNAWVSMQNGEILRYDASALATSGTPLPAAELASGTSHVASLAFSPDGSLWATGPDRLSGWRPTTLAAGGTPPPDVVLTATGAWTFDYPNDIAFDADGGLWVVGAGVARFAADQLTVSGAVAPGIVITSNGTSLAGPSGLAFDANGDLWVASNTGAVEKLRSQDVTVSGAPTPVVTLTSLGIQPIRPRFDADDNLWVSAVYAPGFGPAGYVAMVLPQHRVATGPAVVTTEFTDLGAFDVGGAIVFHPGPASD